MPERVQHAASVAVDWLLLTPILIMGIARILSSREKSFSHRLVHGIISVCFAYVFAPIFIDLLLRTTFVEESRGLIAGVGGFLVLIASPLIDKIDDLARNPAKIKVALIALRDVLGIVFEIVGMLFRRK